MRLPTEFLGEVISEGCARRYREEAALKMPDNAASKGFLLSRPATMSEEFAFLGGIGFPVMASFPARTLIARA